MRRKVLFSGSVGLAIVAIVVAVASYGRQDTRAMVYYYCWSCSDPAAGTCAQTEYETADHESVPVCPEGTFLSQSMCVVSCGAPASSSSPSSSPDASSSSSFPFSPSSASASSDASSSSSSSASFSFAPGIIQGLKAQPITWIAATGAVLLLGLAAVLALLGRKK